jgi:hypothetical protein
VTINNSNQVLLFLSHCASTRTVNEYSRIHSAIEGMGDMFFLYHANSDEIPLQLKEHGVYTFSDKSLSALDYPRIGTSLIPGHAHFPLLQFFRDNPGYAHYWIIEYDVRFSGDWRLFFSHFQDTNKDFLTCHIRCHKDEPNWRYWALQHPRQTIPVADRLRSFNTVYRLSKSALAFLDQSMKDGWCGHHEVLLPTLLYRNGFSIMDIGGNGSFTPKTMENMFYVDSGSDSRGTLAKGTMRFRPCFWKAGIKRNKLYHPVKPAGTAFKLNSRFYIRKNWLSRFIRIVEKSLKTWLRRKTPKF